MFQRILLSLIALGLYTGAWAQLKKVYDSTIDPVAQIDSAVVKAAENGQFVIAQVGGNWCRWCLMFADYIEKDPEISQMIKDNFQYIHVDYPGDEAPAELKRKLANPVRFGFPVMVVLDGDGNILHIQDSSYLEEGEGYNRNKVLSFFRNWSPKAVQEAAKEYN